MGYACITLLTGLRRYRDRHGSPGELYRTFDDPDSWPQDAISA